MRIPLFLVNLLICFGMLCGLQAQLVFTYPDYDHAAKLLNDSQTPKDSFLMAMMTMQREHMSDNLDSALIVANRIIEEAEKENLPVIAANAYFQKAKTLSMLSWQQTSDQVTVEDLDLYRMTANLAHEAGDYYLQLDVLLSLAETFRMSNQADSTLHYLRVARALSKEFGGTRNEAWALISYADYYAANRERELAQVYLDSTKMVLDLIPEPIRLPIEVYVYQSEAINAMTVENIPAALISSRKMLLAAQQVGTPSDIFGANQMIGTLFAKIGMYDSAATYLYSALDIANQLENLDWIFQLHQRLASVNAPLRNEEARRLHQGVVDSLRPHIAPFYSQISYIGQMKLALDQGDSETYQRVAKQFDLNQEHAFPMQIELRVAPLRARAAYQVENNPRKAVSLLLDLVEKAEQAGAVHTVIEAYYHLAKCYLLLKEPAKTLQIIAQAEPLMEHFPYLPIKSKIYLQAIQAFQVMGNSPKIVAYEQKYEEALREEMNAKFSIALQMAETQYRTKEIQSERDLQAKLAESAQSQARQSRNIALLIGAALVLFAFLAFFLYRSRQQQKRLTHQVIQQRDRNETLLRELSHRVKNNLQQISGLLMLQGRQAPQQETKDALKVSQQRMETISLLHTMLYQGEEVGEINLRDYLNTLSQNLLSAYGYSADHMALECLIADLTVDVDTGIAIGLIANELITNAAKYALPHAPYLRVSLQLTDAKTAELIVADRGPGLPPGFDPMEASSYGLQLVQTMSEQMYGEITVAGEKGTEWRIAFSLA